MTAARRSAEVVIIGGGVIGLAVARALVLKGARDVMVIERAGFGAESSSAAAGMLAPQAEADCADEFFQLCCRSRDMYPAFAESLREESGIDIELDTTGTLYVAFDDHDVNEMAQRYEWQSRAGLAIETMGAAEAKLLEPSISENVRAALRFPLDAQVENRRLVSALVTANEMLGVHLVPGTTALAIKLSGSQKGRVSGVETSGGFVTTENVVIAGGAWTSQLEISRGDSSERQTSDRVFQNLRIEPVRGQMLCLEANPKVCSHVIYSPRGYIVPRRDGRLLAGSTTENAGFDKRVTAEGTRAILAAAMEIVPRIGSMALAGSWAGLRPRASDNLPVLGPCAEIDGVFYATGHYRNGILLAPVTGELIAEAIVDGFVTPAMTTFSPDRFDLVART